MSYDIHFIHEPAADSGNAGHDLQPRVRATTPSEVTALWNDIVSAVRSALLSVHDHAASERGELVDESIGMHLMKTPVEFRLSLSYGSQMTTQRLIAVEHVVSAIESATGLIGQDAQSNRPFASTDVATVHSAFDRARDHLERIPGIDMPDPPVTLIDQLPGQPSRLIIPAPPAIIDADDRSDR